MSSEPVYKKDGADTWIEYWPGKKKSQYSIIRNGDQDFAATDAHTLALSSLTSHASA
jgi:hypothetical protein